MNAGPITPAVQQWAERGRPGAQVTGYTRRPPEGGAVARSVDQVTLHLTGGYAPLELVRKEVPAHEIAGLPRTLLHGDVHPGNVLVHADQATLIDWGGSRIGPAALDLANLPS
jgi:thiamine kinase-like enzyme